MVSMLTGNEAIVSQLSSMEGIILILRVVCGSEHGTCIARLLTQRKGTFAEYCLVKAGVGMKVIHLEYLSVQVVLTLVFRCPTISATRWPLHWVSPSSHAGKVRRTKSALEMHFH